jgi:ribose transport system permease protein
MVARLLRDYGMVLVLAALCALFSALTLKRQTPDARTAATELADQAAALFESDATILAVGAANQATARIAELAADALEDRGFANVRLVVGTPRDLRLALDEIAADGGRVSAIIAAGNVASWRLIAQIPSEFPASADVAVLKPEPRLWPVFLTRSNLTAIVDRIVVIAIIAIGMTMVILTGGIDLSVGRLVALSGVIAAIVIQRLGGEQASAWAVAAGFAAGILCCALIGAVAGGVVARCGVAPFIVTLSVMMMARGLAFLITDGNSIRLPGAVTWLGQGRTAGVPNTVILLIVLYAAAHFFMAHSVMGRHIYAVGGNVQAARLSGVPVTRVLVFVYTISGLCAGLGGCIGASQIETGTPQTGDMYEMFVIAAVVLGGTSLAGGSGNVLGTLIGAFIISVIQNGMNLVGLESYAQQVVLGAVILAAVLLDKVRTSGGLRGLVRR